jgi:hypothetical protein
MTNVKTRLLACALAAALVLTACGGAGDESPTPAPGGATTPPAPPGGPIPPVDTVAPTIVITLPTAAASYSTTVSNLALAGTASDNVGVTGVTWRNAANNTLGSAAGLGAWNVASIPLVAGMNSITVTASDGAGNTRSATLAVTYSAGGSASLSGSVDSSLINRIGLNAVYVYSGTVLPDDIGSSTPPVARAVVTQDNNACTFSYQVAALAPGTYTVAFTNQAANDTTADEAIAFLGTAQVTVGSGGAAHDFAPNRRLQVGPTRTLKFPSAAAAIAQDGDVIEIDAAEYLDDNVSWTRNNLTLRGVGGGRAHLRSTTSIANGKGIWVTFGRNTTVENIEFSGATVSDQNGAGIRADENGLGLTVCNGYFHDNENGILGGGGVVLIEYSEFSRNGIGDGQTHNMYIGEFTTRFTLRYSYTHQALSGHTVKSRAQENYILYNRITDETAGATSYEINLPQNGLSYVIGNLIQQGPNTENSTILSYGEENASNGRQELYVVNNTFVNDRGFGGAVFIFVKNGTTGLVANNIFTGGGTVLSGVNSMTLLTNLVSNTPGLVDSTNFDYHLTSASAAIDQGSNPGSGAGFSLAPTSHYVHPIGRHDRSTVGSKVDIGAYEFQ